ncbi:MAG: cysteine--tRNA ligase, partial [Gammaproteobacteria bacterium]
QSDPQSFLKAPQISSDSGFTDSEIETLIEARLAARSNKAWAEADNIRKQLLDNGIALEDSPQGTTWRRG